MSNTLISAGYSSALGDSAPSEIVYIPEGSHVITPLVNGKVKTITVSLPANRGKEIAARFQRDLTRRQGENVRPHLDFDHKKSGPASALPTGFSYRPGVGLILALDWTSAGRSAISGKDFSYFSPDFLLDDDGTPFGLPDRGPVGSLVNSPAFRQMPRIAAADAVGGAATTFEARAEQLVACGNASDIQQAYEQVAASDPHLYDEYQQALEDAADIESKATLRSKPAVAAEHAFETKARHIVAAGAVADLTEAIGQVARDHPNLYDSYLSTLS